MKDTINKLEGASSLPEYVNEGPSYASVMRVDTPHRNPHASPKRLSCEHHFPKMMERPLTHSGEE